jgi:hypothetical protein
MALSLSCRKSGEYIIGLLGTSHLHHLFYTPHFKFRWRAAGAMMAQVWRKLSQV